MPVFWIRQDLLNEPEPKKKTAKKKSPPVMEPVETETESTKSIEENEK